MTGRWSLLTAVSAENEKNNLRFAGAGIWKFGDPEGAAKLPAGGSFTFGQTRIECIDGDWKDAFYAFRKFTDSKGHVVPTGYNPPVHWNELYDNPLWWPPLSDSLENREKYYQLDDMKIEIDFLLAEGDKVDCHFALVAKHTGDFAGIPPKGNIIRCPAISTFRVEAGKLAEAWEIYDSGGLAQQMRA